MELVFLIPITALIAAMFIVKWSLEYSRWKKEHYSNTASTDKSLTTRELEAMIQEAVDEAVDTATAPLVARLHILEARADDGLLGAADGYEALPDPARRPKVY